MSGRLNRLSDGLTNPLPLGYNPSLFILRRKPYMNKILLPAAALLLAACGFHLKGMGGISGSLPYQEWHVAGGQMQQPLENALRRADGKPATQAPVSVTVTNIETRRDIYTITRAADISEFLLILRVEAQAAKNGQPWGEPMVVLVQRKMDYADSEVLGKQEEEATVWAEMRADAADQIVRRLTFLKAD
ncbi:Rare lipoprotein B, putative [Neisseria animaloris]|uniref:LPS-assembly lipoprotein LptE n=2 Tax=Neisseria animaloris TaxID=326522 RepID=A0A3S4ZCC5_9NEIS|nr:Rare lipoprotein B, putative [Neisseria animaloris]